MYLVIASAYLHFRSCWVVCCREVNNLLHLIVRAVRILAKDNATISRGRWKNNKGIARNWSVHLLIHLKWQFNVVNVYI
jgi:hypothetical protein